MLKLQRDANGKAYIVGTAQPKLPDARKRTHGRGRGVPLVDGTTVLASERWQSSKVHTPKSVKRIMPDGTVRWYKPKGKGKRTRKVVDLRRDNAQTYAARLAQLGAVGTQYD